MARQPQWMSQWHCCCDKPDRKLGLNSSIHSREFAMAQSVPTNHNRIVAGLPFVEALARRLAASMPHSIDIGDLVQDGVLGLMDAANRFDEARGIKFETFAERRVRGAMIDALRR
jgi:RNA polymerase sigma factor for flagellar operon FliA